jgi:hypothetical protein
VLWGTRFGFGVSDRVRWVARDGGDFGSSPIAYSLVASSDLDFGG